VLTYLDIQDQVLDITGASSPEERGRVKKIINEVYFDVVARLTLSVKSSGSITLVNLQGDYVLTAAPFSIVDFIAMRSVIYNQSGTGVNNVLRQVTPAEIYDARNQTWSGFLWAFAIEGANKLMLLPSPSTGDTMTLVYEYRPAAMATDSDTPADLLDEDVDTIITGAAFRVSRWKKPQLSIALEADFKRRLDQAQARQSRQGGSAQKTLRTGMRRRPPHDPSTDWRGWSWR
jgi:hypothetical protein